MPNIITYTYIPYVKPYHSGMFILFTLYNTERHGRLSRKWPMIGHSYRDIIIQQYISHVSQSITRAQIIQDTNYQTDSFIAFRMKEMAPVLTRDSK